MLGLLPLSQMCCLFPSRPMMLITFTARCCQCVKNKLLSPLWSLLFSCHGVSLL